jgi:hypothetical protein
MLIDLPQPGDADTRSELVQHAHIGYPALAAQIGKLSPRTLLGQHFHQQIQRMHRREQAQQMDTKELSGGVLATPPAGAAVRPALIDKIVGNERGQQLE